MFDFQQQKYVLFKVTDLRLESFFNVMIQDSFRNR